MTDHRAAMAKAARQAAREAANAYLNQNPEARGLSLRAEIMAIKRRPKEFRGFHRRAVALLLSEPETVHWSNAKLTQHLCEGMPRKAPLNVLTEKLSPSQKRKIAELLGTRGIELDLARHSTVSKIKRVLKGHYTGENAEETAVIEVAFAGDAMVVNGRRHPIHQSGKHRRVHAGTAMLNVDGLKTLLLQGE